MYALPANNTSHSTRKEGGMALPPLSLKVHLRTLHQPSLACHRRSSISSPATSFLETTATSASLFFFFFFYPLYPPPD